MSNSETSSTTTGAGKKPIGAWGMEWWYNAHLTYGAIQTVFIPILVPTYIKDMTGSATKVGIAMAIIGCGGLIAPVIGGLADKFRAHRWAQLAGLVSYVLASLVFMMSGSTYALHLLGAALFGVGSATLLMINPVFVVSAGYEQKEEATRLTRLSQTVFLGSLVAGLALGQLTEMGLSFQSRFLIAAGLAVGSLVLTALTNGAAAKRVKVSDPAEDDNNENAQSSGLSSLLFSRFGLLLLAVFLVTTGHGVITTQYPSYMEDVFSVSNSTASTGLSIAAIVSLIILGPIGMWMGRGGPSPVWITAIGIKVAMMCLLGVLAFQSGAGTVLPLICYVVFIQGVAMVDMVQPALAARLSSAGAGLTQGLLMFAIAGSYAVGSVSAGAAADSALGYSSLVWIVALVTVAAGAIGLFALPWRRDAETES